MEINYIKLYLSLTFAGLTILGADEAIGLYKLKVASDAMAESMKQVKFERKRAEIKLQTEALKIKNEANHMIKINNHKRNSINNARKTNDEVCRFWSKEYSEVQSDRNKMMMDNACERARKD